MVSWKTAFALNAEKKGQDKCQAPMTSVHHVDDTSLLLKTVFPEKHHVKHLLPSVEKMCEHVFMYGYSENMTSYDFEPGALGCTRWVHSGSVAMLLVPAVDLAMNLAKVQKIDGKVMLADMKKWVESIDTVDWTVPQLQDLRSKGIRIFHCKLVAGDCIIAPPGFIVAACVLNSGHVTGIRRSFVPLSQASVINLAAIVESSADKADLLAKSLQSCIDAISLGMKA